jgi:hypothetical protein
VGVGDILLKHAFKEWAVICQALAEGKQALIIRKGGIAETTDDFFQLQHTRFWLFPTYTHQQREGIKPEAIQLLEQVEKNRPPADVVRLSHFAVVDGVYHVHELVGPLLLEHLYLWSEETIRKRFAYRSPGLYVMPVRVYKSAQVHEIPDTAYYGGCRTWVELEKALPTEVATPVVSDRAFHDLLVTIESALIPTSLA